MCYYFEELRTWSWMRSDEMGVMRKCGVGGHLPVCVCVCVCVSDKQSKKSANRKKTPPCCQRCCANALLDILRFRNVVAATKDSATEDDGERVDEGE